METLSMRIMKVVEATGGNKSEFARKVGLTPAYISKLGKQPDAVPSDRTITDICREFNVNEEWLRTGKGEMFIPKSRTDEITAFVGDILRDESDFRQRFISVLARMTTDEWKILEKKILEIAEEIKKADP